MRSLFVKFLAWFILTVVLAVSGSFYVSSRLEQRRQAQQQQPTPRRLYQLQDARDAWEADGATGLQRILARVKDVDEVDAHLTDSSKHDLISGRDWTKEIEQGLAAQNRGRGGPGRGEPNPLFPFLRADNNNQRPLGFSVTPSRSGPRYYLIVFFPPNPEAQAAAAQSAPVLGLPRETWWMLAIFAVLCWVLARHVTSPLRSMQKTVERFGQGDFTARVNSKRHDELGQLGGTVDRMAERIDNLLKSQRRLLQDISHELRSPLARLGVAVELARGGGDLDSSLNRIDREGTRLNTLVGELIQVTRGEGDPQGLITEQIRLDELIGTIAEDARIEAEKRHVIINTSLSEVSMSGNPELLRRAIENLIRNAIRYSPEDTTVDVSLSKVGSVFRISVRDHGTGVPEESLPSIFDPFYRVEKDRGRTSGGVGLGLAIAKRAIELHQGTMRAQNVKPGLRVEIDLPVPAAAVEDQPVLAAVRA